MKRILVIVLFFVLANALVAQDTKPPSAVYAEKMDRYMEHHPQLKAYLHTDKPYYITGDTLWFAAYSVAGEAQIPDPVTGVMYVDLQAVSEKNAVAQQRVAMQGGHAWGQIPLADSLPSGEYVLRAYSHYMRNFPEKYFFQKRLQIFNPRKANAAQDAPVDSTLADCQFFPEGGHLIANTNNRVAFKAVNKNGRSVRVEGVITGGGDTVAMHTDFRGMGVFYLKPQMGEKYKAVVTDGKKSATYFLPTAYQTGIGVSINSLGKSANIRATILNSQPGKNTPLSVMVHSRGKVLYAVDITANQPEQLLNIPRADVAEGVHSITVISADGVPLSERLFYVQKEGPLKLNIEPNKTQYAEKEEVVINLTAADALGKPVSGRFSMAVTDAAQVQPNAQADHILSYLMLSSELKGNLEAPADYFDPNNKKVPLYLDLLLMTQGWRQYDWASIVKQKGGFSPLPFYLEKALSATGQLTRNNGKSLKSQMGLTLILNSTGQQELLDGMVDPTGRIFTDQLAFYDTAQLLVKLPKDVSSEDYMISLVQPQYANFDGKEAPLDVSQMTQKQFRNMLEQGEAWQAFLKRRAALNDVMLSGVDVTAKRKPKREERDTRTNVYGRADNSLEVTQSMRATAPINPLMMLQGRVPGVQVQCSGTDCRVQIRGAASFMSSTEPLYMIDGFQVDKSAIQTLSAYDIERIDVVKTNAMLGSRGANGAINFLTKRSGTSFGPGGSTGVFTFDLQGFSPAKKFYVPRYDLQESPERSLPDFRSLWYWNPDVVFDKAGKAQVRFYTSDAPEKFHVDIQGITETGQIGVGWR